MKPLFSKTEDENCLEVLGRASLQVVHDLKNQLNGLKLYATFLRKRREKGDYPADETETLNKLVAGIDRAAEDLSLLSEFGKPLTLHKQSPVEVQKLLASVVAQLNADAIETEVLVAAEPNPLLAELDSVLITEAMKSISVGAANILKQRRKDVRLQIEVSGGQNGAGRVAIIDWKLPNCLDHDPFRSFAGTSEIRLALAAKVIAAHGGSAEQNDESLRVQLPLIN